mmetsp:Transcript_12182/g.25558  ORF Transcript_12182/g.25558 Transcript_12182/m.25558 type:complete len:290 (-) Transcript_12182:50-919(-)
MGSGHGTSRLPRRNRTIAYLCFAGLFGISLIWPESSSNIEAENPSQTTSPHPASSSTVGVTASSATQAENPSQTASHHAASSSTDGVAASDGLTPPSPVESHCTWRTDVLAGSCVGWPSARNNRYTTAKACQQACCFLEGEKACVAWQFRSDVGCLLGGDVRLGYEKDGPPAWCEPTAPAPWSGQRLKAKNVDRRSEACGNAWNPDELRSQCFGLGPRRTISSETAASCRDACCADPSCETWQWRSDKGCFFGGSVGYCDKADPVAFEAFEGQRKIVPTRTYTPNALGT